MLGAAVRPTELAFSEMIKLHKTRRGSVAWACLMARGDYNAELFQVLSQLHSQEAMGKIRFAEVSNIEGDEQMAHEQFLADKFFELVVALSGQRIFTCSLYQLGVPGRFAGLIDESERERALTLKYLQSVFEALEVAERVALKDPWVAGVLKDFQWPKIPWCRYVLLSLWEVGWSRVPADISEQIRSFCEGPVTSKPCEDGFNHCRDIERSSKSGVLGSRQVWHQLRVSQIAEDCDRAPAAVTSAARQQAQEAGGQRVVPTSIFEGKASELSLGEEALHNMGDRSGWSPMAASAYAMAALGTNALAWSGGDPRLMHKMWMSLLLVPGSVVRHISGRELFMVLNTIFGAVLWPLETVAVGGAFVSKWSAASSGATWVHRMDIALESWQAVGAEVVPPCKATSDQRDCFKGFAGVILTVASKAEGILSFSAKRGLVALTVPLLSRLHTELGIVEKSSRPTSGLGLMKSLLRHILPDLDEQGIKDIISLRKGRSVADPAASPLLQLENLEMSKALIDDEVVEDTHKYMTMKGMTKDRGSSANSQAPRGASSSSSSGSAGPSAARVKISITGASTPEDARQWIPQVQRCWIKRDDARHMRWQTGYPVAAVGQQSSWSKSWSEAFLERAALRFVLAKVWAAHTVATGEPCPWDLDSI